MREPFLTKRQREVIAGALPTGGYRHAEVAEVTTRRLVLLDYVAVDRETWKWRLTEKGQARAEKIAKRRLKK